MIDCEDDRQMMISAFRYALGSKTYIVSVTVRTLIINWGRLMWRHRELIRNETKAAISRGEAGSANDVVLWQQIVDMPEPAVDLLKTCMSARECLWIRRGEFSENKVEHDGVMGLLTAAISDMEKSRTAALKGDQT